MAQYLGGANISWAAPYADDVANPLNRVCAVERAPESSLFCGSGGRPPPRRATSGRRAFSRSEREHGVKVRRCDHPCRRRAVYSNKPGRLPRVEQSHGGTQGGIAPSVQGQILLPRETPRKIN